MPEITINIGISVRPDQGGKAHTYDTSAAMSAKHLFSEPLALGTSGDKFIINVNTVQVPKIAKPEDGDELIQKRQVYDFGNMVSFEKDLQGIDLLYIPGAPVATPSQDSNIHKMKAPDVTKKPDNFKAKEASSRDSFESKLIETAMNRCIPVLAVCAGSWRLLEAFGGQVRELSKKDAKIHRNKNKLWSTHHEIEVEADARGLMKEAAADKTIFQGANTTHWAVADAKQGSLVNRHNPTKASNNSPTRERLQASKLLQVIAKEPSLGTVEGFESQFGIPIMGAQWHPESNLKGQPGAIDKLAKEGGMVAFSQEIFRLMILAAVTAKFHRQHVIPSLRKSLQNLKLK